MDLDLTYFSQNYNLNFFYYWGVADLQCCVSFRYTAKWFSYAVLRLVAQSSPIFCDPMDCSLPGSLIHGDSPDQNTKAGCHALLQGIFPAQGSNPGLLLCRWTLYHLRHQESPRTLESVAYPFSRGSSQPKDQAGFSCIAGRFFISWAIREAQFSYTYIHVCVYIYSFLDSFPL